MKPFRIFGCLALMMLSYTGLCQQARPPVDTLIRSYQKTIQRQNETIEKQDEKIQKLETQVSILNNNLVSQDGNFISHDGNVLTWAGLALTIFTIVVGFGGYFTIRSAKRKLKKIEKKMKANDILVAAKMTDLNNQIKVAETRSEIVKGIEGNFQKEYEDFLTTKNNVSNDIAEMRKEFTKKSMIQLQILPIYNAAMDKMNSGGNKSAIAKFKKVLRIDPDNVNAKACIAICHSGNDDDQALINIGEVINGSDLTEEAWIFYGIILRRVHKHDLAVNAFEKALKFDEESFTIYNHLGYTYMYMGDLQNSHRCFQKSHGYKENNSAASYGRLKLCFLDNDLCDPEGKDELIKIAIKNALNDKEESPELPYYNFGYAFALMCSNEETEKCLEELDLALGKCRNVGILKEQLTDYELFANNNVQLRHLQECINRLAEKINTHQQNKA